ncbi:MAG TPA: phage protease [Myxococcales bacterium]|nr:phage protease [Myxococcales bacterium]
MKTAKRTVLARVEVTDKGPPSEFKLLPMGKFKATKLIGGEGIVELEYELTPEKAKEIADWAAERQAAGVQFMLDYNHNSLEPGADADAIEAAAWYDVELREDGLWAVNVKWEPEAVERLKTDKVRYFSPAFDHTDELEVLDYVNGALVNIPALDQKPLMAASAVAYQAAPIVDGAWDGAAAVKRLQKWASSDGSGKRETIDWKKLARGFAYVEGDGKTLAQLKLPHHDIRGGKFVTVKQGVIAAAAALQGGRGGVSIASADVPAVRRHLERHYHQWGAKAPWETEKATMKTLASHLSEHEMPLDEMAKKSGLSKDKLKAFMDGEKPTDDELAALAKGLGEKHEDLKAMCDAADGDDGDEDEDEGGDDDEGGDGKEKASALVRGSRELLSLLGAKSLSEAKGIIAGLKSSAEGTKDMAARLAALETKSRKSEVEELITQGFADGKLNKELEKWARKMGEKDPEELRGFLSAAPVRFGKSSRRLTAEEEAELEKQAGGEPTASQRSVASSLGVDAGKLKEGLDKKRAAGAVRS